MPLPSTGPISFSMINEELGKEPDALISLDDDIVRQLAEVPEGEITFEDFLGKSYTPEISIENLSVFIHKNNGVNNTRISFNVKYDKTDAKNNNVTFKADLTATSGGKSSEINNWLELIDKDTDYIYIDYPNTAGEKTINVSIVYRGKVINSVSLNSNDFILLNYYFNSWQEAFDAIPTISKNHNYDLSNVSIGFSDEVTYTVNLFDNSPITHSPKHLIGRNILNLGYTFYYCYNMKTVSSTLFIHCPKVINYGYTFAKCGSLTSVPANLFSKSANVNTFSSAFSYCSSLQIVPENLFDNCNKVTMFDYTFIGCTSITSKIPDVWNNEKFPYVSKYKSYAYGCTKASNYNDIPAGWK